MGDDDRPWLVLVASMVTLLGYAAYHLAPASIIPLLVARFGITKADAGLSISVVYLGWLLFQLPSGYLIDRYDERRVFGLITAAFVVAAAAGAVADSYPAYLVTRGISGGAAGVFFTVNATAIRRAAPPGREGLATSLFVGSGPAGMAVGQFLTPQLVGGFDWPVVLLGYAALTGVGYAGFYLGYTDAGIDEETVSIRAFLDTFLDRTVLLVSVAAGATNALFIFLNSWMPTYGAEELSLSLALAGTLSAASPFAGMLGRPSGGWVSDRIGGRHRPVILASFLLVLPLFLVLPRLRAPLAFGGGLLLAGFVLQLSFGIYYVYVQELVDPGTAATSVAVLTSFVIVGGMSAPAVGGWLIGTFSWPAAFAAYAGVGVVGLAAMALVDSS